MQSITTNREGTMQATESTYNGWTNYETWGVNLVLSNDEGIYTMVRERAVEIVEDAPGHSNVPEIWTAEQAARFELADWLRDFTETLCGIGSESEDLGIVEPSMMARQLLGGAIGSVNFEEIAASWIEEL